MSTPNPQKKEENPKEGNSGWEIRLFGRCGSLISDQRECKSASCGPFPSQRARFKEDDQQGKSGFGLPICQWPGVSLYSETPFAVLITVYLYMSKWLAATFCLQSELESERKLLVKNSEGMGILEQL